jgi:3-hydroxyisobutyrate dehydrogenase-like beta-hydroxyacid dehydrogenase
VCKRLQAPVTTIDQEELESHMAPGNGNPTRLGWAGTGRMGYELVSRLLREGHDVAVYNRTRAKAEPLAELGATVVDTPAELGDRDIVFTMVAGPQDFKDVVVGPQGILSGASRPRLIVDSTTVSPSAGEEVRAAAAEHGVDLLAAPVSGNPKVVKAGHLTICVSGPAGAWEEARPYLELLAKGVTYVGEGEKARLVKVCHNLMLGVVSQCMAEITVLAEKGGVSRADFLAFLNDSVMGSMFTRYKTPAFVNLDFTPTFTPALLLKDFHLGFEACRCRSPQRRRRSSRGWSGRATPTSTSPRSWRWRPRRRATTSSPRTSRCPTGSGGRWPPRRPRPRAAEVDPPWSNRSAGAPSSVAPPRSG